VLPLIIPPEFVDVVVVSCGHEALVNDMLRVLVLECVARRSRLDQWSSGCAVRSYGAIRSATKALDAAIPVAVSQSSCRQCCVPIVGEHVA